MKPFDLLNKKLKKNGDKKTKFGSGEDKRAVSANLGAIFLLSFFSALETFSPCRSTDVREYLRKWRIQP